MSVNDPKLLQELLDKIKNTPDYILKKAIEKVDKEWEEEQKKP